MTKRYEEDWEIPDNLKHRVTKVYSNRRPDQEITLNAKAFVEIFRGDLEKWLEERQMSNSSNTQSPTKSKSKNSDKKQTIIQDLMDGSNMTRTEAEVAAEVAAAIELGETDGDLIKLDDKQPYF